MPVSSTYVRSYSIEHSKWGPDFYDHHKKTRNDNI